MNKQETINQSNRTFNKWKGIWSDNVDENLKSFSKFTIDEEKRNGDSVIILAYGPSFTRNIDKIKELKLHHKHDIICVDKALKGVLKNKIIPRAVVSSDARIKISECLNIDEFDVSLVKRISLFVCVTSHPSWAKFWKENGGTIHFYINKDAIGTQREYRDRFNYDPEKGDQKAFSLPAAVNVANTAYTICVLKLQYKVIMLAAFDYSFKYWGNYYGEECYNDKHRDLKASKKNVDNQIHVIDVNNNIVQTSHSMLFSARWLINFVSAVSQQQQVKTINITGEGILFLPHQARLREVSNAA